MLTTAFAALILVVAVQVWLVVTAADRLPAEAITGREPHDAVLPVAGRYENDTHGADACSVSRYAQAA